MNNIARYIKTVGMLCRADGIFSQGVVTVTFTSDSETETLSLLFNEDIQFTVNYDHARHMIQKVRQVLPSNNGSEQKDSREGEAATFGIFMPGDKSAMMQTGNITIGFKSDGVSESLSMAFEDKGAISVDFAPVTALIENVRGK